MLRRLNTRAASRVAFLTSATLFPNRSLLISPRFRDASYLLPRSRHVSLDECTPRLPLCTARRCFSASPSRYLRMGRSVRAADSPAPINEPRGGSTAESLTPYVREHLARVYGLLAAGCAVAGCGSFLMFATPLGKAIPFWLPMVGGFVPLLWLSFAPPRNPTAKLALFFSFTLLEGMALAPLVFATMAKGVLGTAVVLTGAVFFGFSAAAYLAPRASMLALQGPLFGMLIGMVAISVLNLFYPTAFAHSLILYGGLALFSLFVSVDTQAMIERARCGAGDHVQDAMQMFLNVVNIFVRIAQILGSMDR